MCCAGRSSRTRGRCDYAMEQGQGQAEYAVLERNSTRTEVEMYIPYYTAAEHAYTPVPTAAYTCSTAAVVDSAAAMAAAPSSSAVRSDTDSTCTVGHSILCYLHRSNNRRAHRDLRPVHPRPWLALILFLSSLRVLVSGCRLRCWIRIRSLPSTTRLV